MTKLNVPQKDGEVVVDLAGERKTYPVTNGTIDVDDNHVKPLLSIVVGAELAKGSSEPEQPLSGNPPAVTSQGATPAPTSGKPAATES